MCVYKKERFVYTRTHASCSFVCCCCYIHLGTTEHSNGNGGVGEGVLATTGTSTSCTVSEVTKVELFVSELQIFIERCEADDLSTRAGVASTMTALMTTEGLVL